MQNDDTAERGRRDFLRWSAMGAVTVPAFASGLAAAQPAATGQSTRPSTSAAKHSSADPHSNGVRPDTMNTALIIGDVQRGITGAYPFARQVVSPLTSLLPRARAAGVLVVFVHFALRPNRADLPAGNALYASFFDAGDSFHEGSPGTGIDLPMKPEDVVVTKRRAGAFAGTDLDLVLRAHGVDAIALAGVATSAMVAATFYEAADRDYQITVLRDGCADADPAIHDFFMDKVFPGRGAEVTSCSEWL